MEIKLKKYTRTVEGNAKRHGAVFTCIYSRAIYLKLADDLFTNSFIQALRRFIRMREVTQNMLEVTTEQTSLAQKLKQRWLFSSYSNPKLPIYSIEAMSHNNLIHHQLLG